MKEVANELKKLLHQIENGDEQMFLTKEGKLISLEEAVEAGVMGKAVNVKHQIMQLLFDESVLSGDNKKLWNTLINLDVPKAKRKYNRKKEEKEKAE